MQMYIHSLYTDHTQKPCLFTGIVCIIYLWKYWVTWTSNNSELAKTQVAIADLCSWLNIIKETKKEEKSLLGN